MYLTLLLISIILIAISFAALAIRLLVVKDGKFPPISVGKNKEMRKRGITCVKQDEIHCYNKMKAGVGCSCEI